MGHRWRIRREAAEGTPPAPSGSPASARPRDLVDGTRWFRGFHPLVTASLPAGALLGGTALLAEGPTARASLLTCSSYVGRFTPRAASKPRLATAAGAPPRGSPRWRPPPGSRPRSRRRSSS